VRERSLIRSSNETRNNGERESQRLREPKKNEGGFKGLPLSFAFYLKPFVKSTTIFLGDPSTPSGQRSVLLQQCMCGSNRYKSLPVHVHFCLPTPSSLQSKTAKIDIYYCLLELLERVVVRLPTSAECRSLKGVEKKQIIKRERKKGV